MEHTNAYRGSLFARDENASKDWVKGTSVSIEQFEAAVGHAVAHAYQFQSALVYRFLDEWKCCEVLQRDADGLVFQRRLAVAF